MRFILLAIMMGLMGTAEAGLFSKKKGADAEGNCVPELLAENARLFTEIEVLDQVAALAEKNLQNKDKNKQNLGFEGVKDLNNKAKATRRALKRFVDTYGDIACKAQVLKNGKSEVVTIKVGESVASLDKLATQFEQISEKYLKNNLANK